MFENKTEKVLSGNHSVISAHKIKIRLQSLSFSSLVKLENIYHIKNGVKFSLNKGKKKSKYLYELPNFVSLRNYCIEISF